MKRGGCDKFLQMRDSFQCMGLRIVCGTSLNRVKEGGLGAIKIILKSGNFLGGVGGGGFLCEWDRGIKYKRTTENLFGFGQLARKL